MNQTGNQDRRRVDPGTLQTLEAFEAMEIELRVANAKIDSTTQELEIAKGREDQLLQVIAANEARLYKILVGMAASATVIILMLLALIVFIAKTAKF